MSFVPPLLPHSQRITAFVTVNPVPLVTNWCGSIGSRVRFLECLFCVFPYPTSRTGYDFFGFTPDQGASTEGMAEPKQKACNRLVLNVDLFASKKNKLDAVDTGDFMLILMDRCSNK